MQTVGEGPLSKMTATLADPIEYRLSLGDQNVSMNALIGSQIKLEYLGLISCSHCGRKTKKSFSQGHCYPCFQKLARCDSCIVKPEKCHFDAGTCREPDWAERNCMQEHVVYLANSSGLKVGITRHNQIPTRWIDQGAVQALPIIRVRTRQQSGFVEILLAETVADKTNWRAMLKGENAPLDLAAEAAQVIERYRARLDDLRIRFGDEAIEFIEDAQPVELRYPVAEYPEKVSSHNLDKTPEVGGRLMGIKGQYLILDTGVLNVRTFSAYHVRLSA